MAVILILITAIALILYAVVLNLGRISTHKTLVTMASSVGTSFLASEMASYAESMYQVQLGGEKGAKDDTSVCAFTGWFAALIKVALVVAALVIIIVTHGSGWMIAMAIIGLVVAGIGAFMQIAFIQPGITKLWNKQMADMSEPDNFVESGIRTALQAVVTDNEYVPDVYDQDLDRKTFAADGDKINRFAYYYTDRLSRHPSNDPRVAREFQKDLRRLLITLYLPADCSDPSNPSAHPCCFDPANNWKVLPSYCNQCCVFSDLDTRIDPNTGTFVKDEFGRRLYKNTARPQCCYDPLNEPGGAGTRAAPDTYYCGTTETCGNLNGNDKDPFNAATHPVAADPNDLRWIYDPFWEDERNFNVLSMRARIGRDDETKTYRLPFKGGYDFPPTMTPDALGVSPGDMWRLNDTKYWDLTTPITTELPDLNIFPFLYRLTWGVDLRDRTVYDAEMTPNTWPVGEPEKCHWYNMNQFFGGAPCPPPYSDDPVTMNTADLKGNLPLGYPVQLYLSLDPATLTYTKAGWVEGLGQGMCQGSACVSDKILNIPGLITKNDDCALDDAAHRDCDHALDPPWDCIQYYSWKPGADRYCNLNWPYFARCAKYGVCCFGDSEVECDCGDGVGGPNSALVASCSDEVPGKLRYISAPDPGDAWADDPLDEFIYGSGEFIAWAKAIVESSPQNLNENLRNWYSEAATWIEPGCPRPPCSSGFVNQLNPGALFRWIDQFDSYQRNLAFWLGMERRAGSRDELGDLCNEVWCVPGNPDGSVGDPTGKELRDICDAASCPAICPGVKKGGTETLLGVITDYVGEGAPRPTGSFFGVDAEGLPAVGNPTGVINCLNFNALDGDVIDPYTDPFTGQIFSDANDPANALSGNSAKFVRAWETCDETTTLMLPRSLLHPDRNFDTNEFVPPHHPKKRVDLGVNGQYSDPEFFKKCLDDCNPGPGSGDWGKYCEPATEYGEPTPFRGPAKATIPTYPVFDAPHVIPDWDKALALEACRQNAGPDSCGVKYTTCANNEAQCELDVQNCNNCLTGTIPPGCDLQRTQCNSNCTRCWNTAYVPCYNSCNTSCTNFPCPSDPSCSTPNPAYCCDPANYYKPYPDCSTYCAQGCSCNPGYSNCSDYCQAFYISCFSGCTGGCSPSLWAGCANRKAGGSCDGSPPHSCACNEQACRDQAQCTITVGSYTANKDCDDIVMRTCPCTGTYETCAALCPDKAACEAACLDIAIDSSVELPGVQLRPGFQPDPVCLKNCRDINKTCLNNCRTTYQDCMATDSALPGLPSGGFVDCACGDAYCSFGCSDCPPAGGPNCQLQQEIDNAYGSCLQWGDGNPFYEMVWRSWILSQGDCVEQEPQLASPDGDGFSRWDFDPLIYDSYREAISQVEKFKHRAKFLQKVDLGARKVLPMAGRIMDEFKMFVYGPDLNFSINGTVDSGVEKLICQRKSLEGRLTPGQCACEVMEDGSTQCGTFFGNAGGGTELPYHVVYGWQSERQPGKARGTWHFVRVDAKIPGRCKGQCYTDRAAAEQKAGVPVEELEPGFPIVKSYTRHWGTRRCYSLGDSFDKVNTCDDEGKYDDAKQCFQGGVVMTQVVRYDEDADLLFKFANNFNIWKAKFFHPQVGPPMGSLDNLESICPPLTDPAIGGNPPIVQKGAFMLNRVSDNEACWNTVKSYLKRGVASKTCAQYYFHNETPRGMNLKFIPCPGRITVDDVN